MAARPRSKIIKTLRFQLPKHSNTLLHAFTYEINKKWPRGPNLECLKGLPDLTWAGENGEAQNAEVYPTQWDVGCPTPRGGAKSGIIKAPFWHFKDVNAPWH